MNKQLNLKNQKLGVMTISDYDRECIFKILNDPPVVPPTLQTVMLKPLLRVLSSAQATSSERRQAREALIRCVPHKDMADKLIDQWRMRRTTLGDRNLERVLENPKSSPDDLRSVFAAMQAAGFNEDLIRKTIDGYRRETWLRVVEDPDSTCSEVDEARGRLIEQLGDKSYVAELIHSYRRVQQTKSRSLSQSARLLVIAFVGLPALMILVLVILMTRMANHSDIPPDRQHALALPSDLIGRWICVSETTGGDTVVPSYHGSWQFHGDGRLVINDKRNLFAKTFAGTNPIQLRVFNRVAGEEITVSSCIYTKSGNRLFITLDSGDRFPTGFEGDEDWCIDLEFERERKRGAPTGTEHEAEGLTWKSLNWST